MKFFNVKQISDMLETNPETVRRWIRDGKLVAEQSSRKSGNVVSEESLLLFLNASPKYSSKQMYSFLTAMAVASAPLMTMSTVAGGFLAGLLMSIISEKGKATSRVNPAEVRSSIEKDIAKLRKSLAQKQALLEQTQSEISGIQERIAQYENLVNDEDVLAEIATKVNQDQTQ